MSLQVTLLAGIAVGGVHLPVGSVQTFADEVAHGLVDSNKATPFGAGWASDAAALTSIEVGVVRSLVSGSGNAVTGPLSLTADIFDMYRATDRRTLVLPNPYSAVGPDMVHPSVLHFSGAGWNGWNYWMAYTPYPASNSSYENPCIAVSKDGETWQAPPGVTLPLAEKPLGGYNADTHLALSADGKTMYMIYVARIESGETGNYVNVMETTDGVRWSAPVTILIGAIGVQGYASPSIWFDSTVSRWVMVFHNLDAGATYPMQRIISVGPSIYGAWGAPAAISITNPTGGRTWWHSCFLRLLDGRIIGLVQDIVNGGAGTSGALFAAESFDGGLTFSVRMVYREIVHYRPAISLYQLSSGVVGVTAWIGLLGGTPTFIITREDWLPGASARSISEAMAQIGAFGTYPSSVLWFDTFNRADGVIGVPLVGGAVTADIGTFTVASTRAQSGSPGNNRALTPTLGTANYIVGVDIALNPGGAWLIFRAVDTNNFWRVGFEGAWPFVPFIQSVVAGGFVVNRTLSAPSRLDSNVASACRLTVVCRGRRFRIYVNNALWEEVVDGTFSSTGVRTGIQGTNAGAAFDNLLVLA